MAMDSFFEQQNHLKVFSMFFAFHDLDRHSSASWVAHLPRVQNC
jgi:hypothetical protein